MVIYLPLSLLKNMLRSFLADYKAVSASPSSTLKNMLQSLFIGYKEVRKKDRSIRILSLCS